MKARGGKNPVAQEPNLGFPTGQLGHWSSPPLKLREQQAGFHTRALLPACGRDLGDFTSNPRYPEKTGRQGFSTAGLGGQEGSGDRVGGAQKAAPSEPGEGPRTGAGLHLGTWPPGSHTPGTTRPSGLSPSCPAPRHPVSLPTPHLPPSQLLPRAAPTPRHALQEGMRTWGFSLQQQFFAFMGSGWGKEEGASVGQVEHFLISFPWPTKQVLLGAG